MRPIVHIGVHKTATDWFQKKVYPSAASHRLIDRTRVREALIEPAPFIYARRSRRRRARRKRDA